MQLKFIESGKLRLKSINMLMFVIIFIVRTLTVNYESAGIISQLKYAIALLALTIAYCTYLKKPIKKRVFYNELSNILLIVTCFLILSLFRSIFRIEFSSRTLLELFFLVLPIVYAYLLLNILELEEITYCMKIILLICMVGYFFDLGMNFNEFINGLFKMKFSESSSILESNTFAGCSIALAFYFLYHNENKIFEYLSIFFVILTFKRLAVVYVIFTWCLLRLLRKKIIIKNSVILLSKILFVVLLLAYYYMLLPQNVIKINQKYGIDISRLTMSRSYRFRLLYNSDFISYGLGSSSVFLRNKYGFTLEMDLIKIFFELGFLGIFIFINNLFNIVKGSWYRYVIIIFIMLNSITSHSLAEAFSWIILYLAIGSVSVSYYKKGK